MKINQKYFIRTKSIENILQMRNLSIEFVEERVKSLEDNNAVNDLEEFKYRVKKIAFGLKGRGHLHYGAFPMKRITDNVLEGTVTYYDLDRWYNRAIKKLNTKR